MTPRNRKNSLARRLHRSFGAGAAIFVLFMVLSGIAINHSNDLGLDQRPVVQTLLLDWYGLDKPKVLRLYLQDAPPYYLGTEIFNYDTDEGKRFVWLRDFQTMEH